MLTFRTGVNAMPLSAAEMAPSTITATSEIGNEGSIADPHTIQHGPYTGVQQHEIRETAAY